MNEKKTEKNIYFKYIYIYLKQQKKMLPEINNIYILFQSWIIRGEKNEVSKKHNFW